MNFLRFLKQKEKAVLLLGMGKTGCVSQRFFRDQEVEVVCFDDQKSSCLNNPKQIPWEAIGGVMQSPGISEEHIVYREAVGQGIPIFSDIDILRQQVPHAKWIGITGTNGKSTTTKLIHHILNQKFPNVLLGGNIGEPALGLPLCDDGIYVLELSSYQLISSHLRGLDGAVWTNLTEDHLERHKTMANYIAAKKRIFNGAQFAAIGIDDESSRQVYQETRTKLPMISVSTLHEADCYLSEQQDVLWEGNPTIHLASHPYLLGAHNFQNRMLAYVVARHFGVETETIQQAIGSFKGLPHRIEKIAEFEGVMFVNDSKATNAESLIKALSCFPESSIYLIAGGRAKHDGLAPAIPYMQNVQELFLIGEASERFALELGERRPYQFCEELKKAIKNAFLAAKNQKKASFPPIVLLSPACASFDQFKNFEDRGDYFRQAIQALMTDSKN